MQLQILTGKTEKKKKKKKEKKKRKTNARPGTAEPIFNWKDLETSASL